MIEIEAGCFIGVDIGSINITEITSIIDVNKGKLLGYFLTHSHGDHTVGIKKIWELYKMPIYCSSNTSSEINNPRKNFSIYSEEIETFSYDLPCKTVEDHEIINFGKSSFEIMHAPGHSPGCIVIFHNKSVFTGDFLMKDFKTPLNLPNSSRKDYNKSRENFKTKCSNNKLTFYPGHGKNFTEFDGMI
ncbi:MBL fold metallo-hydrolase [Kaistella sp.]|uniref:MBL fold metallo-hydrolase n=1 Tax=Kaistella sp. TaxID=2782235 RepID=UPI003C6A0864